MATEIEKSSGAYIASVSGADVLVKKLVSPEYCAVIEWVPTASAEVVNVACPCAPNAPVPIWVMPSRNATLPVGVPLAELDTVAVNVTCSPAYIVRAEEASAVEVGRKMRSFSTVEVLAANPPEGDGMYAAEIEWPPSANEFV